MLLSAPQGMELCLYGKGVPGRRNALQWEQARGVLG